MRLVAPASAASCAASATTAAAALLGLVAVAAVHRAIAAGLKGDGGLLSAAGADHGSAGRLGPLIAATASSTELFVLLCLAARFAALGRRVPALAEERLIVGRKGEILSAVAARELLISSHGDSCCFPKYPSCFPAARVPRFRTLICVAVLRTARLTR